MCHKLKASIVCLDKTIAIAKYLYFQDERANINGFAWILQQF
jgi:hypothetical protein